VTPVDAELPSTPYQGDSIFYTVRWIWSVRTVFLTDTFPLTISLMNEGSVPFKVSRAELQTDWSDTYQAAEVPLALQALTRHDFVFAIHVPSQVSLGMHQLYFRFFAALSDSQGFWGKEQGPFISGPEDVYVLSNTITGGRTQTISPTVPEAFGFMAIAFWFFGAIGVFCVAALLIYLTKQKPKQERTGVQMLAIEARI